MSNHAIYCWYQALINLKLNPKYYTLIKYIICELQKLQKIKFRYFIRGALKISIKLLMMEKQPQ